MKYITDDKGRIVHKGKNLAAMLRHTTKYPVISIQIERDDKELKGRLYVTFDVHEYPRAETRHYFDTMFESYDVLVSWLHARRNLKGVYVTNFDGRYLFTCGE